MGDLAKFAAADVPRALNGTGEHAGDGGDRHRTPLPAVSSEHIEGALADDLDGPLGQNIVDELVQHAPIGLIGHRIRRAPGPGIRRSAQCPLDRAPGRRSSDGRASDRLAPVRRAPGHPPRSILDTLAGPPGRITEEPTAKPAEDPAGAAHRRTDQPGPRANRCGVLRQLRVPAVLVAPPSQLGLRDHVHQHLQTNAGHLTERHRDDQAGQPDRDLELVDQQPHRQFFQDARIEPGDRGGDR
ncbi:hypothetical protein ACLQ28_20440 [Micromonospora sp. DT201]|uniref:hypothetical protein n=1 Tax=Micromonospora sp. DT201 TaxID=3393442 RepID=UPI003CEC7727